MTPLDLLKNTIGKKKLLVIIPKNGLLFIETNTFIYDRTLTLFMN